MILIGLMSGTSADGIDAVAAEIGEERPRPSVRLIAHTATPYPPALRARILAASEGEALAAADVARLHARIGEAHAEAASACLAAAGLDALQVDAVATHGQTVAHLPEERPRATLQLGDPSRIAHALRRPVVADFRSADIAAGGEGAPLVPFADWVLFAREGTGLAVQNVGGIANVTVLPPDARSESVFAFDTGPGNMVSDGLVARLTDGAERFDRDGARAARGTVDEVLLDRMLAHDFFASAPPKSTGREAFGASFVDALVDEAGEAAVDDLIATATALTARSIARAYRDFVYPRARIDEVIVGGGGARNPTLLGMLRRELGDLPIRTSDELGVPAQAKEALAFAILGAFALRGETNTLPRCTGASRAVVGGAIWRT